MLCLPPHLNCVATLPWKLKTVQICCRAGEKCTQNASIFICIHYNGSCLLTYYLLLPFMVSVKHSWNNRLFYVDRSKCCQCPCTMGIQHCATSRAGYTSLIWPNIWPPNSPDLSLVYRKIWGVVPQPVHLLRLHTLTNRSSACWMFGVGQTTVSLTMQPSAIRILVHVCGKSGHLSNIMTVLISFHFCYTWYDF